MTLSSLFSVILVATTAVASPLIFERDDSTPNAPSIPIKTNFKTNGGGIGKNNIMARDRARLQVLLGQRGDPSTNSFQLDASAPVAEAGVSLFFTVSINLNLTHLFSSYRQLKFVWETIHIN